MSRNIDFASALGMPSIPSHSPDTIAAVLWAREVLQQHISTKYSVTDSKGIEELKPVNIGGAEQWLHIRSRNRENPVLLCLHGGPGYPGIGLTDEIQRPWEDYFTVVQWDQRQAGKSYNPADSRPLTMQQFIEDTAEVIQYLRDYLNKEKLFLMGCSWGTVLGMHMANRHSDWLHAYIGVGQVVNKMDNEREVCQRLLARAKEQQNDEVVAKLESIAPYPDPACPEQSYIEHAGYLRMELSRLAGDAYMHHFLPEDAVKMITFERSISPHLTLTDLSHVVLSSNQDLINAFFKEYMQCDLPKQLGLSFNVPIFFFTGAHDWHTPRSLSDHWISQISAPYKEVIHFEESSHTVLNEEPGKMLMALVNKVLPFAETETKERANEA